MQSILEGLRWLLTKTLPCGRLLGIPMRVHLLLAVFMPLAGLMYANSYGPALGWGWAVVLAAWYLAALYLSILAHELGHAWGFRLVGGQTEMIILTPVGGVALGTGSDQSPRSELLVTALGPAVSVVLAIGGALAAWGAGLLITEDSGDHTWALHAAARMLASINIVLALFNLLFPLFPMDCARLIRAALSLKYNPENVTMGLCKFGVVLGIFLVFAGLFRIELPFIGPVSWLLMIIGIIGVQLCAHEMERVRHMGVYSKSDNWSGRTVYYDGDTMESARSRAREDLGGLLPGGRKPGRVVKSARVTGPAKVIDVAPAPREPIDVEALVDPAEVRRLMRDAAAREDFREAARLKARLRELEQA